METVSCRQKEDFSRSRRLIVVNEGFGELLREVEKEAEKNKLASREDHHGIRLRCWVKGGVWELTPFLFEVFEESPSFVILVNASLFFPKVRVWVLFSDQD